MSKIIYAIIDLNNKQDALNTFFSSISGISGEKLYAVTESNISAIASSFSSGGQAWAKEKVLEFASVTEKLSEHVNLLPVRFGTILKSDDAIRQLLIAHLNAFETNLRKTANKTEFGLKVLWDFEKTKNEIKKQSRPDEISAGDYFKQRSIHTNYLFEKMKQHKLDDAVLQYVEKFIGVIKEAMQALNPDIRFKKMVSDSIMLDAVFLVNKKQHHEFRDVIISLGEQYPGLQFLLTGPWPPYSFVDIRIEQS